SIPAKKIASSRRQRSGFMQLLAQPGARRQEVALDRLGRYAEGLGRLLQRQPGKVPVLDHLAPPRVRGGQAAERQIEREDLLRLAGAQEELGLLDWQRVRAAAPLVPPAAAGVVDQQAAHGAGGDGEEAGAVLG